MTADQLVLPAAPRPGLVTLTHAIYGLHGFSALMGLLGSAFVVTTFLSGWPSLLAVLLNYLKRRDVRATYLDSHFGWQIRTFWYALAWFLLAWLLAVTLIGIPFAFMLAIGVGLWVLYRIVRGWLALAGGEALPLPT